MTTASLAVLVLTNAHLALSLKVKSILSTLTFALTAVLALTFVLQVLLLRANNIAKNVQHNVDKNLRPAKRLRFAGLFCDSCYHRHNRRIIDSETRFSGTSNSTSPKKLLCSFNQQASPAIASLPQHLLVQNHAVGSIFCRKGIAAILHAKHHQRFISIVSDGTLAGRCHAHHTAF